jgi:uncharacterized protein (DUF342 family)
MTDANRQLERLEKKIDAVLDRQKNQREVLVNLRKEIMATRDDLLAKIDEIKTTVTAEAEQAVTAVLVAVQTAVAPLESTIEELKEKIESLESEQDFSAELTALEEVNTGVKAIIADTPVDVPPEPVE